MKITVIMLLLFLVGGAAATLYYSSDVADLQAVMERRATVSMPTE